MAGQQHRAARTGRATRALALTASICLLAGCATTPPTPAPLPTPAPTTSLPALPPDTPPGRLQVVFASLQQVGVPYAFGGATPAGFDCSGLVQYVFRSAGVALPRTAADQFRTAAPLPLTEAGPGDLLFFRDGLTTSHVGIYLGQGRFVHAPRSGRSVALESFDNGYWRSRFAGAGRVMGPL